MDRQGNTKNQIESQRSRAAKGGKPRAPVPVVAGQSPLVRALSKLFPSTTTMPTER
jgi:hypothetical protein